MSTDEENYLRDVHEILARGPGTVTAKDAKSSVEKWLCIAVDKAAKIGIDSRYANSII